MKFLYVACYLTRTKYRYETRYTDTLNLVMAFRTPVENSHTFLKSLIFSGLTELHCGGGKSLFSTRTQYFNV